MSKKCQVCQLPLASFGPLVCDEHGGRAQQDYFTKYSPVKKPTTNETAGLYFWSGNSSASEHYTLSTWSTDYTPWFCRYHWRAHQLEACPLCESTGDIVAGAFSIRVAPRAEPDAELEAHGWQQNPRAPDPLVVESYCPECGEPPCAFAPRIGQATCRQGHKWIAPQDLDAAEAIARNARELEQRVEQPTAAGVAQALLEPIARIAPEGSHVEIRATTPGAVTVTFPAKDESRAGPGGKRKSMAKKPKAQENVTGETGEQLEIMVALKPDVIEHKRDKALVLLGKYRSIKAEMDAESKTYRVKLKEIDKEIKELQEQIDTCSKRITVIVREEPQLETHSILKRRTDNGAVVDERAMSPREHAQYRQVTLDQVLESQKANEAAAAKSAGRSNGNGAGGKPKATRKRKARAGAEASA